MPQRDSIVYSEGDETYTLTEFKLGSDGSKHCTIHVKTSGQSYPAIIYKDRIIFSRSDEVIPPPNVFAKIMSRFE